MIEYRKGSLFESNADALVHGCNTKGFMNAGIATDFKRRFPEMFEDYIIRCRSSSFQVGTGYMFKNKTEPHVINLATQTNDGAQLIYIESALRWLEGSYKNLGIKSAAMPRIGSGLGRLEWESVKDVIEKVFSGSELKVEIWSI